MSSQAAAEAPLPGVLGIAFLGFPLHPPKRPARVRAEHLDRVVVPMLFVQGTRDDLADLGLMREVTARLGARARLHVVEGGDHSFKLPAGAGRSSGEVVGELAGAIADWGVALPGAGAGATGAVGAA
jgi:predicted alpha/beta-hydrolase family hydrolase